MDLYSFLQALYIISLFAAIFGFIAELTIIPKDSPSTFTWVECVLAALPVINSVVAISVWAVVIQTYMNDTDDNPPTGGMCTC